MIKRQIEMEEDQEAVQKDQEMEEDKVKVELEVLEQEARQAEKRENVKSVDFNFNSADLAFS